ncbi:HAAS signaling domain-containing protein [Dactylosporangium sp. CA-139066]|uniref:HAAS signaling domain-containing protein n=1 Tax=Dactylosporangium sp. CA-139066 TaxID=3239930 RepID=UPI003D92C1AB
MTAPTPTPAPTGSTLEIDYYLERVGAALADLPADVRDDLMEDLPAHFAEVLEEQGGPLVERLGPPAEYAAELRAAAGLQDDPARRGLPGLPGLEARLARMRRRLGEADRRAGTVIGYERASDFVRLLRPAWWVVRGIGLVAVVFALDIIPRDRFDDPVGWVLVAAAVIVSVRIGATGRPHIPRWVGYGLTAVAAIGVLTVIANADRFDSYTYTSDGGGNPYGYVTDVYPVDRNGHPIQGVTLLDQNGNPIQLGDPWRCATADHQPPDTPAYPMCQQANGESPSSSPSPSVSPSAEAPVQASPSVSASPSPSR